MEYTIEIAIHADHPLTVDELEAVAELAGAAAGNVGEHQLEVILTGEGADVHAAGKAASRRVLNLVPGLLVGLSAMTTEEFDRREAERYKLVGVGEIADILGVSKQRASVIARSKAFPDPKATTGGTSVWLASDVSLFSSNWKRQQGRPKNVPAIKGRAYDLRLSKESTESRMASKESRRRRTG